MDKSKIKIGFLNPANQYMLDWVDPDDPSRDYNLPYEAERSAINIEEMGYQVIRYPGRLIEKDNMHKFKSGKNSEYNRKNYITNMHDAIKAAKKINKEGVDCVIFYMSSYFSPNTYLQAAKLLKVPVIIWAPEVGIAGGLVLKGAFNEVGGIAFKFFYSDPDEKDTLNKIDSYILAAAVRKRLSESICGKFGGRGVGINQAIIDQYEFLNIFGVGTKQIDMLFLVERAKALKENIVKEQFLKIKEKIKSMPEYDEIFEKSIRFYLAIKETIKENHFDFISLKCGSQLTNTYIGACLAQNLLINEGMATTCNGDDRGAITTYILNLLTNNGIIFRPDIYLINKKEKKLYLRSDGIGPLNMSTMEFTPCFNYQYRLESPSGGICMTNAILKPGKVNLFWLSKINGKYIYHISEGESIINKSDIDLTEKIDCFSNKPPWGFVKIDGNIDKFIDNSNAAFRVVILKDVKQEFIYLTELLKIETIFDG